MGRGVYGEMLGHAASDGEWEGGGTMMCGVCCRSCCDRSIGLRRHVNTAVVSIRGPLQLHNGYKRT